MKEKNDLQTKITKEIFTPVKINFPRIKIVTHYKDECWSIDLIDRSNLSQYNKGYKFIFTIIDNHTKYAWAVPIKNKQGSTITDAFKNIITKSKRKPHRVWSDRGKEFYNSQMLNYLKQNEIEIYSTYSDLKAVFIERFNRTLIDLIKIPMYIQGTGNWLDCLQDSVEKYNNKKHSAIQMTPHQKSNSPNICYENISKIKKEPKFKIDDFVRIPDKRNIFSKQSTTNWSRELFKIKNVNNTNPVTYTICDENQEIILGKYYEQELLKSEFNYETNRKILESMNIEI